MVTNVGAPPKKSNTKKPDFKKILKKKLCHRKKNFFSRFWPQIYPKKSGFRSFNFCAVA